MPREPKRPVGNWLLDALPDADYERLLDDLKPVTCSLGDVIYESGGEMKYVCFPTTSHVSLLYTMLNGSTAEMGLVGKEGWSASLYLWVARRRLTAPSSKAPAKP
jgi:hypothetical protein